jgi:hypothetical protein
MKTESLSRLMHSILLIIINKLHTIDLYVSYNDKHGIEQYC